jgi:hypothetical protein
VARVCVHEPLARSGAGATLWRSVAVLAGLAEHPDWRVREYVALTVEPHEVPMCEERLEVAMALESILRRAIADPDLRVVIGALEHDARMHGHGDPRAPFHGSLSGQGAVGSATSVCPDGTEPCAVELVYGERMLVASGRCGPVPDALLGDPICRVRGLALASIAASSLTEELVADLRGDPCPLVREALASRVGPATG